MYKIKDMKRFKKLAEKLGYLESEGHMMIKFYKGFMITVSFNGYISMQTADSSTRNFPKIHIKDLFDNDLVEQVEDVL